MSCKCENDLLEKYVAFVENVMSDESKKTDMNVLETCVYGLNGEAGELIDHIKKVRFQGKKLSIENVVEELGDCLWYIAAGILFLKRKGYKIGLKELIIGNMEKLNTRYSQGVFSVEESENRDNEYDNAKEIK